MTKFVLFLESSTLIDNSVSKAINKANVISLTKNVVDNEKNIETQVIASKFTDESGNVTSGRRLWPNYGYFLEQTNNFDLAKVNYPENCILYINQGYSTIKNNKNRYYADHQILGKVIEALNPPKDVSSFVFKEREIKMTRPYYDPTTGEFLGLYDSVGFLVVLGDEEEHFRNYGYDESKSKLLYSFYKRSIPNAFAGTMFNRHRIMFESGESNTDSSKVYFFLSSITDRSEEMNQYMKCVNIHPIDLDEKEFENDFNSSRLDFINDKKEETTNCVLNMLKKWFTYRILIL